MPQVLIIEDDADIRSLYRRILEQACYQVVEAADGSAGISVFSRASTRPHHYRHHHARERRNRDHHGIAARIP